MAKRPPPVDPFFLYVLQSEVAMQCRFVLYGAELYDEAMAAALEPPPEWELPDLDGLDAKQDLDEIEGRIKAFMSEQAAKPRVRRERDHHYRIWFALQCILTSAANLSKLLWGSDDRNLTQIKREQRERDRRALRKSLGVTYRSPLRPTRVRNDFEHIDQKIEQRWRGPNRRAPFVGRNIGDTFYIRNERKRDRFGHYDPRTGRVTFWDRSVSVPALVEAARELLPVALAADFPRPRTRGGGHSQEPR